MLILSDANSHVHTDSKLGLRCYTLPLMYYRKCTQKHHYDNCSPYSSSLSARLSLSAGLSSSTTSSSVFSVGLMDVFLLVYSTVRTFPLMKSTGSSTTATQCRLSINAPTTQEPVKSNNRHFRVLNSNNTCFYLSLYYNCPCYIYYEYRKLRTTQ